MGPRLVATRMLVTQHLGQVLLRLPFNTHKQSLLSRLTVSGRGMSLLPTCSPAPPEIFTWLFINVSSLLCSTSPPVNHFSHWSPEHEKWMRSRSTCPGALAQVGDLQEVILSTCSFNHPIPQHPQHLLPHWAQYYLASAFSVRISVLSEFPAGRRSCVGLQRPRPTCPSSHSEWWIVSKGQASALWGVVALSTGHPYSLPPPPVSP